ncbi:hypothetical protein VTN49DRAFT_6808 [Thermomyces lanuginosus]|uniref:uncharacterized protein n=1 Tax=Thermomyces lanuginosus TaxID=5541 RepID=UPI00374398C9
MSTSQGTGHRRNVSRSSRPRSSTKGPLDMPDDDTTQPDAAVSSPSPRRSEIRSPVTSDAGFSPLEDLNSLRMELDNILAARDLPITKDLSFLLRPDLYHPLSQLDVPPMFRSPFQGLAIGETLTTSLSRINALVAEGHFLIAAHLCGLLLTSSILAPTDTKTIFTLLYTRLSCLQLTGNTVLAAQESKALEDLNSAFYYVQAENDTAGDGPPRSYHIVPWPLRVLAVRLQSIGFGDSRRGIAGLYELGLEARRELLQPGLDPAHKKIWQDRLEDLSIRVVNALIELGDLDAARRTLETMSKKSSNDSTLTARRVLLHLRIGDVAAAKRVLEEAQPDTVQAEFLNPMIQMTEGRYDEAAEAWKALLEGNPSKSAEPVIKQNLAVCLLYIGKLSESRSLLESLISSNQSFQSLTFNLATIYELCSDRSRNLKLRLADAVAKQPCAGEMNLDRNSADFKLVD